MRLNHLACSLLLAFVAPSFSFLSPSLPFRNHIVVGGRRGRYNQGLISTTSSFVEPVPSSADWHHHRRASAVVLQSSPDTSAEDQVKRLQDAADKLRAEIQQLEEEREQASQDARLDTFNKFDKNKDGVVEKDELRDGLQKRFGLDVSESQMTAIFDEFDKNKDGVLQVDEFQVELIRSRLESLQRAEAAAERERVRLEKEAALLEKERASLKDLFGEENLDNGIGVRTLSCLPYILPLADSAVYGKFILTQFPVLGNLLAPFVLLFRSVPLGGLLCFWAFSTLSRNRELPRLLRFNLQQAVLLDIALFFPSLIGALGSVVAGGQSAGLPEPVDDLIFLAVFTCVLYSWAGNILSGKCPNKIPLIGDATDRQIGGPFED